MNWNSWRGALGATMLQLAVLTLTISSPARAADAEPKNVAVKIDNFTFGPARVTVPAGTTVTWDNEDDIPHTVTSSAKLFKSKVLDTADKFSFTFTTPGVFEYFCSLHPHMTGTIVVEATTGSNASQ
jgi:plastocyanin